MLVRRLRIEEEEQAAVMAAAAATAEREDAAVMAAAAAAAEKEEAMLMDDGSPVSDVFCEGGKKERISVMRLGIILLVLSQHAQTV